MPTLHLRPRTHLNLHRSLSRDESTRALSGICPQLTAQLSRILPSQHDNMSHHRARGFSRTCTGEVAGPGPSELNVFDSAAFRGEATQGAQALLRGWQEGAVFKLALPQSAPRVPSHRARAVTAGWLDTDSPGVRPPALHPSHRVKAPGLSEPQPRPCIRTAGEPLRKWLRLGLPGWSSGSPGDLHAKAGLRPTGLGDSYLMPSASSVQSRALPGQTARRPLLRPQRA